MTSTHQLLKSSLFTLIAGVLVCSTWLGNATPHKSAEAELEARAKFIRQNYAKYEFQIPMRDGVKLFTAVYIPYDRSQKYPILMWRTPYSTSPYGAHKYPKRLGPHESFEKERFIFVNQDVRGRFMSEGTFVNMRPQTAHLKKDKGVVDDATDAYDTIELLIKNLPQHNNRVGILGISYPGYYASVAGINSHPALKAISPQAPIADWFFDDFHRNGVFVTPMAFYFLDTFGQLHDAPFKIWPKQTELYTKDGYQFFKELGPLSHVNRDYFKGKIPFWNEITQHPNYDQYWQEKNVLPHLKNVKPHVLVVGGWYDLDNKEFKYLELHTKVI